jgi:F1F0 ATPase subunit 2
MELDEQTMIDLPALPLPLILPACLAGGLALGLAYFQSLRLTADLIVRGGRPFLGAALTLGRFAGLGAGLYVAVAGGAPALLAALAGVIWARRIVLRRARA